MANVTSNESRNKNMKQKDAKLPKPEFPEACRRQLAQNLVEIQDAATHLETLLRPSLPEHPAARGAFGKLASSVSRALSLLNCTRAAADQRTSKRLVCRRRSQPSSWTRKVVSKFLDDGHSWRKYGQKDIQCSNHPRSYFRCTHKNDQGESVQASEVDPSSYMITYFREHTCQQQKNPTLSSEFPEAGRSEEENINGRQGAPVLLGCIEADCAEEVLPGNPIAFNSSLKAAPAAAPMPASMATGVLLAPSAHDHGDQLISCSKGSHGKSLMQTDFMEDMDELGKLLDFDLGANLQYFSYM